MISCYTIQLRFFFCSKLNLPNLKLNLHRKTALPLEDKTDLYNIPLLLQHITYLHYSSVLLSAQIICSTRVSRKKITLKRRATNALRSIQEHEELKIQDLSVGKYLYTDIFLLEGNTLRCKLVSLPTWKKDFSLPLPAAHRPIENIAEKRVTLKHQQRSSGSVQSMRFPSVPFCYCYTDFILKCYLLPCLKLDCLSASIHTIVVQGTCAMEQTYYRNVESLPQISEYSLKENETRCHFVIMVFVNIYGR